MYIKKSVLIICSIVLIIVTSLGTMAAINPFGSMAFDDLLHFSYVGRMITETFYEEIDSEEYKNFALYGLSMATGDPYTMYLWGDDAEEYMSQMEGNYQGVGLYIENNLDDNTITVISAIAGSPAEEAGITTGDKILKVDGVSFIGEEINEATAVMRGEAGTSVTLTILRKSSSKEEDITLVRKEITIECVEGEMLDNNIGLISISQFLPGAAESFTTVYDNLKKEGMDRVIIDLRNNPGGIVEDAVAIADIFLTEGQMICYTQDRNEAGEEFIATKSADDIPVVLLTNGGSASASELLVGALKDYGRAYVIGEKTYGKGIVQGVAPIGRGGILSVTIARYFTPGGICIHDTGISPDMEIPMALEKYGNLTRLPLEEDDQLKAAVEYIK